MAELHNVMVRCGTCSRFVNTGMQVSADIQMSMQGMTVTCGTCGRTTPVPGFELYGLAVEGLIIARTLDSPVEAIQQLIDAIRAARNEQELRAVRENSTFTKLKKLVPLDPKAKKVYLALLGALVVTLKSCHSEPHPADVVFHAEQGGIQNIHIENLGR